MLSKKLKYKKSSAYSLAEILIVLIMIGIIALLTMPPLLTNVNDYVYKITYKRAIAGAISAWANAVNDGKMVERPTWGDDSSRVANFETFKSYFNITKDCSNVVSTECWADAEKFNGHPVPQSITPSFIDGSGMAWSLEAAHESGGTILLDINGLKLPNQYGLDRFALQTLMSDQSGAGGIPTLLIPFPDATQKNGGVCPSGDLHPCYFTSWVYETDFSSGNGNGNNNGGGGNNGSGGNNGNGKNK